jgi:hypothetical protein
MHDLCTTLYCTRLTYRVAKARAIFSRVEHTDACGDVSGMACLLHTLLWNFWLAMLLATVILCIFSLLQHYKYICIEMAQYFIYNQEYNNIIQYKAL